VVASAAGAAAGLGVRDTAPTRTLGHWSRGGYPRRTGVTARVVPVMASDETDWDRISALGYAARPLSMSAPTERALRATSGRVPRRVS
jgi:hypothetical protein